MKRYITLKRFITDLTDIDKNGIYKIYHLSKPNIVYVGSTFRKHIKDCKKGFYGRWIEHFSKLNRNKHHSKYLQNVVNKYGIEGLRFEIIEICENINLIRQKELEYIDLFNAHKNGYNSSSKTEHCMLSTKNRKKFSIRMRINNPMKQKDSINKMLQTKKNTYKNIIYQYDLEGNFIKEWDTIQDAAITIKVHSTNIFRALSEETKKCKNYLWFYKDSFSEEKLQKKLNRLKIKVKRSKESTEKSVLKQNKKVCCFDMSGKLLNIFPSIKEAGQFYNIYSGNISKCLKKKQKTSGGLYWEYHKK